MNWISLFLMFMHVVTKLKPTIIVTKKKKAISVYKLGSTVNSIHNQVTLNQSLLDKLVGTITFSRFLLCSI